MKSQYSPASFKLATLLRVVLNIGPPASVSQVRIAAICATKPWMSFFLVFIVVICYEMLNTVK